MSALDGGIAIVTGAGRGIGRGPALLVVPERARVIVNGSGGAVGGEAVVIGGAPRGGRSRPSLEAS